MNAFLVFVAGVAIAAIAVPVGVRLGDWIDRISGGPHA